MDTSDYVAIAAIFFTLIIAGRQEWFIRRQNKIEQARKLADKRIEAIKLSSCIGCISNCRYAAIA